MLLLLCCAGGQVATLSVMDLNAYPGIVKSWNGAKGKGFIISEFVCGDVEFSRTDLPSDHKEVLETFLKGKPVTFYPSRVVDDRYKASDVRVLAVQGAFLAGQITFISSLSGYGIINSSSFVDELYFDVSEMGALHPEARIRRKLVIFKADDNRKASEIMFQSNHDDKIFEAPTGERSSLVPEDENQQQRQQQQRQQHPQR